MLTMIKRLKRLDAYLFSLFWRNKPPTRLGAFSFRLLVLAIVSGLLSRILPAGLDGLFHLFEWLCLIPLAVCAVILFSRWIFHRALWTVRARIIVTCLLMGLAPIVLFGTLAAIASYVFCGQFATSVATEALKDDLQQVQERAASVVGLVTHMPQAKPPVMRPETASSQQDETPAGDINAFVTIWRDGSQLKPPASVLAQEPATFVPADTPAPPWLHSGFHSVVVNRSRLFLCAAQGGNASGHQVMVLACSPFRNQEVELLAQDLGSIHITKNYDLDDESPDPDETDSHDPASKKNESVGVLGSFSSVHGGKLTPPVNFFDIPVYFNAPLHGTAWPAGKDASNSLLIVARPSALYRRLFANSLKTGVFVHGILIGTAITFGVLELLACTMAIALSRTITGSISDLYEATQQIDRGNLDHQIPVRRRDQLAKLAASFNTMTSSLKGLLEQQREKDRMLNELKIAQEVQRNLFPHKPVAMPGLELYGICTPARTVGGDYYDFIPYGASKLYLAFGDISGKGISAALLMASLHSAVRAYLGDDSRETIEADLLAGLESGLQPGRLLGLLNRHLFSSTQPSKYATLFVACYDSATGRLTYSNGGHLPPMVLCADGSVKRLDCGGSVVGLFDHLQYQEETVQMGKGDMLLAFSDGLTEPERQEVEFGEERLIELVRSHQILPLPDIAARALTAVRAWIGDGEQPDDITLMLARLV
jgi:sigma-B regulation protein RsbU (phosphoserine phosphatase)